MHRLLALALLLLLASVATAHGGSCFRYWPVPPKPRVAPPDPPPPVAEAPATWTPRMPRALPMWWERHAPELLTLKHHIYTPRVTSSTPIGLGHFPNRKDAQRPMRRAIQSRLIPGLVRVLHAARTHREIRIAALIALGRLEAPGATAMMRNIALDKTEDKELRITAVMSLRLMRGETGRLSRFLRWLDIPKAPLLTRRASVVAAGRMVPLIAHVPAQRAVDSLRAIVRDPSRDPEIRVPACFALADARTPASRLDLLAFARSDDVSVRIAALLGLSQQLGELDREQRLRARADARALGGLAVPQEYRSMIDLCRALHSDRSAIAGLIRRVPMEPSASLALGLLLDARPAVLAALRSAVRKTSSPLIRKNAAIALAMLRKSVQLDLLPRLRSAEDYSELASIVEILGYVGTRPVVDPLLDILLDPHRPAALRASAAQALGRAGDLRPVSAFANAAHLSVPELDEPVVEAWLAQR